MAVYVNGKKREWSVRKSGYHILTVLGIEGIVFFQKHNHKKKVMKWIGDVWIENEDGWEDKFKTWQSARKAVETQLSKRLSSVEIK